MTLDSVDVIAAESAPEPLPLRTACWAELRCIANTIRLLSCGRVRQPTQHVGEVLHFADGSSASVYRETVVDHVSRIEPTALVVEFRLRFVRGRGHAWFRAESILNTPLFVGFRGFVSKLWLAHDENGVYRGVYEWDGPGLAHAYARSLWWILALVSEPGSVHYAVVPGCARDDFVGASGANDGEWWRITAVDWGRKSRDIPLVRH